MSSSAFGTPPTSGRPYIELRDGENTRVYVEPISPSAAGTAPANFIGVQGDPSGVPIPISNSSLTTIATNTGNITHCDTTNVTVSSLPSGLATTANQTTANNSLATIATNTSGLATASNQSTANSSLATIATNTTGSATASNQVTTNNSLSTIATNTTGLATASNQTTTNSTLTTIATNTGAATPAGENHIGEVGGSTAIVTGNFTRPANTTAYASGQLVANNTSAGSVTPITLAVSRANDKAFTIPRIRLKKSNNSLTNASFRVHLFRNSPTMAVGDAGTFAAGMSESEYLGSFDVTMDRQFSDLAKGIGVPNNGSAVIGVPSSGTQNIFALIEARAAYTPASGEIFTVTAEVLRD